MASYRTSGSVTVRAIGGSILGLGGLFGQWELFQSISAGDVKFTLGTFLMVDGSMAALFIGAFIVYLAATDDDRRDDRYRRDQARVSDPGFDEELE